MKKYLLIKVIVIIAVVIFPSCQTTESIEYQYQVPEQTSDGWETASLTDVGINPDLMTDLMNRLLSREFHMVHSIVLVRYGKLVFDEYFPGFAHPTIGSHAVDYNKDTWHVLSSATKSYTSALLGIAIKLGYIKNVNQKVFDFFPELAHLNTGRKSDLTIKHMITMSSGLQWDQISYPILDPKNDIAVFQQAADPWELYLSRPLVSAPGEEFLYSEGSINVVGEIIKRASGIRLDHCAELYLFTPLNITIHWWALIKPAINWVWASGDLRQVPRDMAKFGELYLRQGVWQGNQVVPSQWVRGAADACFTFTAPFWSVAHGLVGYSYAWWVRSSEYDLVSVFTGGSYSSEPLLTAHEMMTEYILPALK